MSPQRLVLTGFLVLVLLAPDTSLTQPIGSPAAPGDEHLAAGYHQPGVVGSVSALAVTPDGSLGDRLAVASQLQPGGESPERQALRCGLPRLPRGRTGIQAIGEELAATFRRTTFLYPIQLSANVLRSLRRGPRAA